MAKAPVTSGESVGEVKVLHRIDPRDITNLAAAVVDFTRERIMSQANNRPRLTETIFGADYELIIRDYLKGMRLPPKWADVTLINGETPADSLSLPLQGWFIQGFNHFLLGGQQLSAIRFELVFPEYSKEPHVSYKNKGHALITPANKIFNTPTIIISTKGNNDIERLAFKIEEGIGSRLRDHRNYYVRPTEKLEESEVRERCKRSIKKALLKLAGNLPKVYEIAEREIVANREEYGSDLMKGIDASAVAYISQQLLEKGMVLDSTKENSWAMGLNAIDMTSEKIFSVRKITKPLNGKPVETGIIMFTNINTEETPLYIPRPWMFFRFLVINHGVSSADVLNEIRLAEARFRESVGQSIALEVEKMAENGGEPKAVYSTDFGDEFGDD